MWIAELNREGSKPIPIGAYDNKKDAEKYLSFEKSYIREGWTISLYESNWIRECSFYCLLPKDTNEDTIMEYLEPCKNYSIIIRTRYTPTEAWDYSNELCITEGQEDIFWLNDWHEGQKYVDFIAYAEISEGGF